MDDITSHIAIRRTFAIISHPDAGKTTITEKLLLFGGLIQNAGSIRAKKTGQFAASDWMAMEQQRGISVTTSVMQFDYNNCIVNLLDTPGHADFSEDTYRTLTAVDSVLMVLDGVKGVEQRTIKLMEVCRLRTTPIMSFINKMDRGTKDCFSLLDEIESTLNIECSPITWPIGSGSEFVGVYHLYNDEIHLYNHQSNKNNFKVIKGLTAACLEQKVDKYALQKLRDDINLIREATPTFDLQKYLNAQQTPVFFGSAMTNFGVNLLLDFFVRHAPAPRNHPTTTGNKAVADSDCSGFVFKIQANMDPKHRDRMAFVKICSGIFTSGMKWYHCRTNKYIKASGAVSLSAGKREQIEYAYPGDIVGIFNHGTLSIGDTFTQGKKLKFTGIPHFAPEIFKIVMAKDPFKAKQLHKGLQQLSEEGATQSFTPNNNNNIILGAVGALQFEVVSFRLQHEYNVECIYQATSIYTIRWLYCAHEIIFDQFKTKFSANIGVDHYGYLVYLASSRANLSITMEKWSQIKFASTREH